VNAKNINCLDFSLLFLEAFESEFWNFLLHKKKAGLRPF